MRLSRFTNVAALCLLLAACSPSPASVPATPATTTAGVCQPGNTTDEKVLIVAEQAYGAAASAFVAAAQTGQVPAADIVTGKVVLAQAYAGLGLARQAYKACDAQGVVSRAAEVLQLVGRAKALLPKT